MLDITVLTLVGSVRIVVPHSNLQKAVPESRVKPNSI
jgi:hypothetical protein